MCAAGSFRMSSSVQCRTSVVFSPRTETAKLIPNFKNQLSKILNLLFLLHIILTFFMLRRSGFGRSGPGGVPVATTRCHRSNYCNRLLGVRPSSQQNRRLGLVDLHPFILEPQRKRIRTKHGGSQWPIKFWFWVLPGS